MQFYRRETCLEKMTYAESIDPKSNVLIVHNHQLIIKLTTDMPDN